MNIRLIALKKYMEKWNLIIYAPAYNVEKSIETFLNRIERTRLDLEKKNIGIYKLIIVNDGSTDKTKSILEKFKEKNEYLEVIDHGDNLGPIQSIVDGMKRASMILSELKLSSTIIIRMDTDMEHDPTEIERIIEPIVSGKTKVTVGIINFSNYQKEIREVNEHFGSIESREFLGIEIPQFCPGFIATQADIFEKNYPILLEQSEEFKRVYGEEMLVIDFMLLLDAQAIGEKIELIKLGATPKQWIKKINKEKIESYASYHEKLMEFANKIIQEKN